jgi:hypothetical protein
MNAQGWLIAVGILVVAAAIVLLWPTPDPLAGVQTVAITGPDGQQPGLASQVLQGLEIALDEQNIKIVANASQADAIVFIEPQSADIRIDAQGFRARVQCLVTREDGSQSEMDLYVTVDERGLSAKLESRRLWEFWR